MILALAVVVLFHTIDRLENELEKAKKPRVERLRRDRHAAAPA